MQELVEKVKMWGAEKGILHPDNLKNQFLKFDSECGELSDEIIKGNAEAAKMELGDCLVTLIILSEQVDVELVFRDNLQQKYDLTHSQVILIKLKGELGKFMFIDNNVNLYNSLLGHIIFVLDTIAKQLDSSSQECLQLAYDKIKNRTGKTENGVFIKE